jgi:malate synthase
MAAAGINLFSSKLQEFLLKLHERFDDRRRDLLSQRTLKTLRLRNGEKLDFLEETKHVRAAQWRVANVPSDLLNRRIEITGPAEPKMIINALNSGANVFMADLEDSLSPTWDNLMIGQQALYQAVRKNLSFTNEAGKEYRMNDQVATLIVRPRGLHLEEMNWYFDGQVGSGSLIDFGIYFFHNAQELLTRSSGPYFYIPKLESHLEARWWNDVFAFAEAYLGIPKGSIRATCLIETINAAFEMDEILFELRDYAAGLNAGRWDYIFSFIKKHSQQAWAILPDRNQVTMSTPFLSAYCHLLVQTCHKRGAHAIGGMSAFIPNRKEPEVTTQALEKVSADKRREAGIGFDGSWVAHPDLVLIARAEFDRVLGTAPHQKHVVPDVAISAADLLSPRIPDAKITEAGVRLNINVALLYIDRWLDGVGAAAIHNLMEDAATAEISRSQLWQWLHHGAKLDDQRIFTRELFLDLFDSELGKLKVAECPNLVTSAKILRELVLSESFQEFLTVRSYKELNNLHKQGGINEQYIANQQA